MKMVDWDKMEDFDRYGKLSDELKEVNDSMTVIFCDDGKDVNADIIQNALKEKGQKGIKARDSIVFHVKEGTKDYEVWLSATAYTNLRELKKIRDNNKGTLIDANVKVTRVSANDPDQPSFKFEAA